MLGNPATGKGYADILIYTEDNFHVEENILL